MRKSGLFLGDFNGKSLNISNIIVKYIYDHKNFVLKSGFKAMSVVK